MDKNKDLRNGLLASAGFHLLLLLVSFLITVRLAPEVKEYVELSFTHLTAPLPVLPARPKEAAPEAKGIRPEEPSIPVELPVTKQMVERELIPIQAVGKLGPQEGGEPTERPTLGEKEPPKGVTIGEGKKGIPTETPGEREGPSFTIEGPAAGRTVLSKVLPQYPPGHQREVVVKAKLTVLPDGAVSEVIPLQKGDPLLDELTIKALSRWKFNPLPSDLPQVPQEGRITFIYRLK